MTFARTVEINILRSENSSFEAQKDTVAIEAPLEMYVGRVDQDLDKEPFSITMRTPGHDRELIAGLLFSEGVIIKPGQIDRIEDNIFYKSLFGIGHAVNVWLTKDVDYSPSLLKRNVVTTSSCGFCGRLSMPVPFPEYETSNQFSVAPEILHALPQALRNEQVLFKHTGGIHAAALFDRRGLLLDLYEDVGRHNAMDKLVGGAVLRNTLPFSESILCFSGRVSFELMQKAIMARVPVITSIGAPSSLAVEMAKQHNVTLIGFLRSDRFNVYHQHVGTDP